MQSDTPVSIGARQKIASALLVLFLLATLLALTITLLSVSVSVRLLAWSATGPIVALTIVFLYFGIMRRPWSHLGAAALGAFGVTLRLVVSTQPQLEVGGGLPTSVDLSYLALGASVLVSNLWAFTGLRSSNRSGSRSSP
jgi:hypothetical protein